MRFFDESIPSADRLKIIESQPDVIVQDVVGQHPSLAAFSRYSLNTMRYVTFISQQGDIQLLSTVLRMGVNNDRVDNARAGGCFCGIDAQGRLRPTGHNLKGEAFKSHPDSGIVFKDFTIPCYQECKKLVMTLAPRFYGISRLISWDLALDVSGSPLLVEANMTYGGCNIPQVNFQDRSAIS